MLLRFAVSTLRMYHSIEGIIMASKFCVLDMYEPYFLMLSNGWSSSLLTFYEFDLSRYFVSEENRRWIFFFLLVGFVYHLKSAHGHVMSLVQLYSFHNASKYPSSCSVFQAFSKSEKLFSLNWQWRENYSEMQSSEQRITIHFWSSLR